MLKVGHGQTKQSCKKNENDAKKQVQGSLIGHLGEQVLRIGLGAFCAWIGSREFQRATGQDVKEPGFRWGKVLAGTWLVFFSLESHFSPSPNSLRANNESEAAGMLIATMLAVLGGMLLVAYSVKPRKTQPGETISQSKSAQDGT